MSRPTRSRDRTALLRLLDAEELTDPQVRRLTLFTTLAPDSLQHLGQQALATAVAQRRASPFAHSDITPPRSPAALQVGTTTTGQPYTVDEDVLAKHLLTIGQSGAGKTTLFYQLLAQLDVPFWSFDLKQDYRHLVQGRDDLLVLPWTELKFNPLTPPPGVPPRRWAQVVSEIFGHATALLSGSKNYLLKSILDLYWLYGLFEEQSAPYPSLHELEQLLAAEPINYVRKTSNYRDTVLNRIEAMTLGAGPIFDCSRGYSLADLLARNVVFEFDGLNRDTQNFLMELLLAWVYEYRLANTHRDTGLNHVFVLDEAKQIFSVYKERQDAAGIPAIDELTAKLREFGEGLLVGDQEATKLTDSIKANTYTKVLLPTGDRKQFEAIANSMHLTEYQEAAAVDLAIGEAIVQTGNADPVRVTLDEYDLAKDVTDGKLRERQQTLWEALDSEPREQPPRYTAAVGSQAPDETTEDDRGDGNDEDGPEIGLSEGADQLLENVLDQPFLGLTERYAAFPSREKGHAAKTELVDAGVVRERTVPTSTGAKKLLELTESGRDYVATALDREPAHTGRGGIVHRYWQHRVKRTFDRAGWVARREYEDADVYVRTGAFELAVEIAMTDSAREVEHVRKQFGQGRDVVWVVCRSEAVREGLQRRLDTTDLAGERVIFREVRDFAE